MDQGILYVYGTLKPFELFILALSYYLHPTILLVLDHALEAKRIGYIDYPGSIADILDIAGYKCSELHHIEIPHSLYNALSAAKCVSGHKVPKEPKRF
jgi:hypothetical protein